MQAASAEYKEMMHRKWRNQLSYLRVTIGVINQKAQASAKVNNTESCAYYSNLEKPLNNYSVKELYAVCDQNYTKVDGSMFFLPHKREDVVLNQGIVSESIMGGIEIQFPIPYDIKGLTVEFGNAYPVDFSIISNNNTISITGNKAGHFETGEIFDNATFLRIIPKKMMNGQSRLRIHQITMGIGIYFDNRNILSATKKEHISPISEELPAIDFDFSAVNKNKMFDIENESSVINYLEDGQSVEVLYGQALDGGDIEWMPGVSLTLREWSADNEEASFHASDRFDNMNGTYYGGRYHPEGISLYDLAVDVFNDAGIDPRTYWLDMYLKNVKVMNPMPVVRHKEALQLIANAGRCILYQDRKQKIILKSSFVPDMTAESGNEAYFSNVAAILDNTEKMSYALAGQNHTTVEGRMYFLPRESNTYLNVGYVSDVVANEDGVFEENPLISITMEAAFKCFGLTLEFGQCWPETVVLHSYYGGELLEDYEVTELAQIHTISHEFPEMDRLDLEFTKGRANNRVILDNIIFGDSTDYIMKYGTELTKMPKGTKLEKVGGVQVVRTLYNYGGGEPKELLRESVILSASNAFHTFYFSKASYDINVYISGASVPVVQSSAFSATVEIAEGEGVKEVVITGKEYLISTSAVQIKINKTGQTVVWENPLVSDINHAADIAEWLGDYLKADKEYDLQYRGEPRLDANDIVYLENTHVPDCLIRIQDHTLKFDGGMSGTIKARREMSNVAATQNRLARRRVF